jgi:hypothetical protein
MTEMLKFTLINKYSGILFHVPDVRYEEAVTAGRYILNN